MTLKEWMVPGVVIAFVSGAVSFGGSWAVSQYRTDRNEQSIAEVKTLIRDSVRDLNSRVDGMDKRLNEMSRGAVDTARLEEQNKALSRQIAELKDELRDVEGKSDARYDNLSTRLARQGY